MTETLYDVTKKIKRELTAEEKIAAELVARTDGPPGHETGKARRISTSRGIDKCLQQVLYWQVLPGLIDPI